MEDPERNDVELQKKEEQDKKMKKDEQDLRQGRNFRLFVLYSYLYGIQGIVSGFASTMPYIYDDLPDTSTMVLFNSVNLPFSFKFLIAPLLQKYSFVQYGKRKTWMMTSLIMSGLLIFVASWFTEQKYANLFAIIIIVVQSFLCFLDISEHASMVKQFKQGEKPSIILAYAQMVGILLGGLLLLKLTSKDFASSVGLSSAITTPQVILMVFSFLVIIPILYIHFRFKETILKSEIEGNQFSLCQVISYYKVFLKSGSRYFRTCIFFLIFIQGFNFFNSLYDYQLVKAGFSRDTSNTLGNIIIIPIFIFVFYFPSWTKSVGGKAKTLFIISMIQIVVNLYLLIVFPLQVWIIAITAFVSNVISSWTSLIKGLMINQFPVHALSGMFITLNASFANFGSLTTVHTWISEKIGWQLASYIGSGIQLLLTVFYFKFFDWMEEGDVHVPKEIEETGGEAQQK